MGAETNPTAAVPGGGMGETPARCPRCQGPFGVQITSQGIKVDRCGQCKGVWLDKGEINFFTEEWEYLRDYALNRAQGTQFPCPSCGARLEEGKWTSAEIKVDKCPSCGGLFFEAGELAAVGRLHPGVERALALEHRPEWLAFPRVWVLAGAALAAVVSLLMLLGALVSGGSAAGAAAVLGLAMVTAGVCRFTGNELGDTSVRAVRGLEFPMSVVPQHVSLYGNLVVAPDEIRLVDATGSVAIWKRMPLLQPLDGPWVERVRRLPPDSPVRVTGWYKAFPFHRLQVVRVIPPSGGPGSEIRSLTERALEWGLYGGGALLLALALLVPAVTATPTIEWTLSREQAAPAAEAWLRLGIHAAHQEKYSAAREHLRQAIESDVEGIGDDRAVSEAHFNLAVISLLEQRTEEARKELAAALAKDARNSFARDLQRRLERGEPFNLPSPSAGGGK